MNVDSMMFAACKKLSRYEESLAWYMDFVKIKEKSFSETCQLFKMSYIRIIAMSITVIGVAMRLK
jgi:hypothetical protein